MVTSLVPGEPLQPIEYIHLQSLDVQESASNSALVRGLSNRWRSTITTRSGFQRERCSSRPQQKSPVTCAELDNRPGDWLVKARPARGP